MASNHDPQSWRDWIVKDRVSVAVVVLAGYVVKRLLPEGWFSTAGTAAFIAFFVVIWWKHRDRARGGRRPAADDWMPGSPGSFSDS